MLLRETPPLKLALNRKEWCKREKANALQFVVKNCP